MANATMQFNSPHKSLRTVCMYCDKERIARGQWQIVKSLLEAPASHGVCPSCYKAALDDLLVQMSEPQKEPRIA